MVSVVQLVRTLDCGSRGRGFESPHSPHYLCGSLAQLAEHLTLNQGVTGSIPVRSTIFSANDDARVVELVDTLDLGSSAFVRRGSSPLSRTIFLVKSFPFIYHPSLEYFYSPLYDKLFLGTCRLGVLYFVYKIQLMQGCCPCPSPQVNEKSACLTWQGET